MPDRDGPSSDWLARPYASLPGTLPHSCFTLVSVPSPPPTSDGDRHNFLPPGRGPGPLGRGYGIGTCCAKTSTAGLKFVEAPLSLGLAFLPSSSIPPARSRAQLAHLAPCAMATSHGNRVPLPCRCPPLSPSPCRYVSLSRHPLNSFT